MDVFSEVGSALEKAVQPYITGLRAFAEAVSELMEKVLPALCRAVKTFISSLPPKRESPRSGWMNLQPSGFPNRGRTRSDTHKLRWTRGITY